MNPTTTEIALEASPEMDKLKRLEKDSEILSRAFIELQQRLENEEYQKEQLHKEIRALKDVANSSITQDKLDAEIEAKNSEIATKIKLAQQLANAEALIQELNYKLEQVETYAEEERQRFNASVQSLNITLEKEAERSAQLAKDTNRFGEEYTTVLAKLEVEKKRNETIEKQKEQALAELQELEEARHNDILAMKEQMDGVTVENQSLQTQLEEVTAAKESDKQIIDKLNEDILDLKEEILQFQEKLETESRYAQTEKVRLKTKVKNMRDTLEKERQDRSELSHLRASEVTDLQEKLSSLSIGHAEVSRERDQLMKDLSQKEQIIAYKNKELEMSEIKIRTEHSVLQRTIDEQIKIREKSELARERLEYLLQAQKAEQENEIRGPYIKQLEEQKKTYHAKMVQLKNKYDEELQRRSELEETTRKKVSDMVLLRQKIDELDEEIEILQSTIERLREELAKSRKQNQYYKDTYEHDDEGDHEVQIVWMDETHIKNCLLCQKEFSMFRTKHHCKRCGRVFCGDCTSNKFILPNVDKGKLDAVEKMLGRCRVCDLCYTQLTIITKNTPSITSVRSII